MCFFEGGSIALLSAKNDARLSLSFKGKRNIDITVNELLEIPKVKDTLLFFQNSNLIKI
jgi:hypothetical protein